MNLTNELIVADPNTTIITDATARVRGSYLARVGFVFMNIYIVSNLKLIPVGDQHIATIPENYRPSEAKPYCGFCISEYAPNTVRVDTNGKIYISNNLNNKSCGYIVAYCAYYI